MKLAELQECFWRLITAPEPVARALPGLAARHPELAPLCDWIAADSEAAATERLDVYANMYFFRLLGVLREDYPNLLKLVGDDAFHNLATDYFLAHPSDVPSLRWIGRHLPRHLETSPVSKKFPAAAALARLEWVRGEAFDAEDAPTASAASLAAASPEAWSAMRLRMQPALRLIELDHRVLALWLALERGHAERPDAPAELSRVVIWRRGFRVYHRAAEAPEMECLELARSGATFAEICEKLWHHVGSRTPEIAVAYLGTWIDQEMVASVDLPPGSDA
jgi:hypothetical protein